MARALRVQSPGACYPVTSRGSERKNIHKSQRDREKFLFYLETATERCAARIYCYCLMSNHYHLLLETPEGNLPQIMRPTGPIPPTTTSNANDQGLFFKAATMECVKNVDATPLRSWNQVWSLWFLVNRFNRRRC